MKRKCPKTIFSDNCIRNIFATIRLRSFSSNIDENEVCTKKIYRIFKKINTFSFCLTDKLFRNRKSFVWPNNYVLEKLLWKQKSWRKWKLRRRSTLVRIFSYGDTWRRKIENKYDDVKVKSLKPWATSGLLLKPGPWKTWNLKNLDPEKPGSWETCYKYKFKK